MDPLFNYFKFQTIKWLDLGLVEKPCFILNFENFFFIFSSILHMIFKIHFINRRKRKWKVFNLSRKSWLNKKLTSTFQKKKVNIIFFISFYSSPSKLVGVKVENGLKVFSFFFSFYAWSISIIGSKLMYAWGHTMYSLILNWYSYQKLFCFFTSI